MSSYIRVRGIYTTSLPCLSNYMHDMTTKPSTQGRPFFILQIFICNSYIVKLGVVQPAQQMATASCYLSIYLFVSFFSKAHLSGCEVRQCAGVIRSEQSTPHGLRLLTHPSHRGHSRDLHHHQLFGSGGTGWGDAFGEA